MKTIIFYAIGVWSTISVLAIGSFPIFGIISFSLSLFFGYVLAKKGKILEPKELNDKFEEAKPPVDLTKVVSVIAPNGCESYLTPGKEYKIRQRMEGFSFDFMDDKNDRCIGLFERDAYLNYGTWIIGKVKP